MSLNSDNNKVISNHHVHIYDKLRLGLVDLHSVQASIEEYKITKQKDCIHTAINNLNKLSLSIEILSKDERSHSRQNSPMLMKLLYGIEQETKNILNITCNVNKSSSKQNNSSNSNNNISPLRNSTPHRIRDSLHSDITAHNAHKLDNNNNLIKIHFSKQPLQGFLKKQGEKGMKLWSIRWFRQINHLLYYFDSENSTSSNGNISISHITDIKYSNNPNSCEFHIITNLRVYRLQTLTLDELQYWKQGLEYWRKKYPLGSKLIQNKSKNLSLELSKPLILDDNSPPIITSIISKSPPELVFNYDDNNNKDIKDHIDNKDKDNNNTKNILSDNQDLLYHNDDSISFNKHQSSFKTPQTLEDALDIIQEQQKLIFLQNQQISHFENQESLSTSDKITELRKENNYLRSELELKDSLLMNFEQNTSSLKKETLLHRKLSGVDQNEYVSRLLNEIQQMENKLRKIEDKEIQYRKSHKKYSDKIQQLETKLHSSNELLNQMRMEMKGKDKYITKLTMELKQVKKNPSKNKIQAPSGVSNRIREEIERLKESIQAHQTRNVFLSSELNRIEDETNIKLEAKQQTIERLENELETLTKEFQQVRNQNYLLKGADNEYLQELENLKKALFYAIGVGIKLNFAAQELSCNVDIQSLYYQAQHIHWKEWNEWLTKRINEHVKEQNK